MLRKIDVRVNIATVVNLIRLDASNIRSYDDCCNKGGKVTGSGGRWCLNSTAKKKATPLIQCFFRSSAPKCMNMHCKVNDTNRDPSHFPHNFFAFL